MTPESDFSPGLGHHPPPAKPTAPVPIDLTQRFCHGTRADLKPGDLLGPGYSSIHGQRKKANHIYFVPGNTYIRRVWELGIRG
jgi:Rifampin ADP-ribosyl transferase